jgi:hypothetical protein
MEATHMPAIGNMQQFQEALSTLSDKQQRLLGARFIAEVMDLTDDRRLKNVLDIVTKADPSQEELTSAFHWAQSAVVELSLHSGFELVDFRKQAASLVAQSCAACASPLPGAATSGARAWNVAHYCRAARICASMAHDQDAGALDAAEKELEKTARKQYELATEMLNKGNA